VEIKAIEPPPSIRDAMEKQMRAERDRRAAILHAEGLKQANILTAEGEKQAAVLRAEGDRQSRILTAEGQAKAIRTVVDSIHAANPDSTVMAYQYLQALPQIAAGQSNTLWIVPAELTRALEGIGGAIGGLGKISDEKRESLVRELTSQGESPDAVEAREAAEAAAAEAASAARAASAEVSGR
jgi:regulator of protease activity HflC (stomatin/prohibitin superfamily)